uniref:Uncharacterized protein n=1 Tax=Lepeophtheirus salmonis TaxID=72036 RepID=A0A0K2TR69_LEPSM
MYLFIHIYVQDLEKGDLRSSSFRYAQFACVNPQGRFPYSDATAVHIYTRVQC